MIGDLEAVACQRMHATAATGRAYPKEVRPEKLFFRRYLATQLLISPRRLATVSSRVGSFFSSARNFSTLSKIAVCVPKGDNVGM